MTGDTTQCGDAFK